MNERGGSVVGCTETVETMETMTPLSVCGRRVITTLAEGTTYCTEERGRCIVLKKIEPDCMLGAQLHPSIRERLARVRELAHAGVANFHGVERDGDDAYLVWDYVEGTPYEQYPQGKDPEAVRRLARDLTLAVEAMHARGLVHGALHGRNVFVRGDGSLQITHISPLLYSEVDYDLAAVTEMTGVSGASLAEIRAKLGVEELPEEQRDPAERRFRFRSIVLVIIAALLGGAVAAGAWKFARAHPAPPPTEDGGTR